MRVSAEEKEILRTKARESGQSVSDLLRQGVGLEVSIGTKSETPASPPEHSASEIKRLAMQRHGHLPLAFAERKVREEFR